MSSNNPRINGEIAAREVRLVDETGEMAGVISIEEAIEKAESLGFDLVEVSPNAKPPVCKILDYGKYKYQQQKRLSEARKKQKVTSLKEIKLRPNIDPHDLQVKMNNVKKFLDAGDKVKFSMRFRGREMSHQHIARDLFDSIKQDLGDSIKVEYEPRIDGRQMIMIVSPVK